MVRCNQAGSFRSRAASTVMTAVVGVACLLPAGPATSEQMSAEASLSVLIEFVQDSGWRARLGPVCMKLGVGHLTPECIFKQISVEDDSGKAYPHGANVPVVSTKQIPYVLLFHLNPLIGEFLIVSPRAELIAIYVRSKGTDYQQISNEQGQRALNAELKFWSTNLDKIKALPKLERPDRR